MRHRLGRTALGALVVALLASGCMDIQAGTPTAQPGPPTTTSGAADRYGAPAVNKPLNADSFLTQPCSALNSSQLETLGLPAQGVAETTTAIAKYAGPFCHWTNSETAQGLHLTFMTGNKNGLADYYRVHQSSERRAYWIETTVDGYPAVFQDITDNRKDGTCDLTVGISNTLTFRSTTQSRLGEKSCDQAKQAASLVITTLRAGG